MGLFHGSVLCFSATEDQQFLSNFWLQCWETQLAAIRVLQGLKPEAFVEGEERDTQTPQAFKLFLLSYLSNLSKQIHENCAVSTLYLWLYIFSNEHLKCYKRQTIKCWLDIALLKEQFIDHEWIGLLHCKIFYKPLFIGSKTERISICHYWPGRVLLQSDVNRTVAHVANTLLSTQEKLLPLICLEQIPKSGHPGKVWKESNSSDQYWKSIVWTHVLLGLEARNSITILNSEPSTQRVNASLAQLYRPCFSRTCCAWINKHRGRPSKTCQETIVQYNWSRISIKQLIEGDFCLTLTTLLWQWVVGRK